jgi:murein DD-endopeptidase MepM/ murein hydrolase activator NlpD
LATTYNHLSAFYVDAGQTVARRQRIGAVGCTGYCTGPHLHFEVRVNGTPVDPMPYLR